MQPITLKLFFTAVCTVIMLYANGQTCKGSLGNPVINETFGAGPNPGAPLPPGVTTMNYVSTGCPNDSSYTIANSSGICFGNAWHVLTQDHTGDPNGYMMIVNASYQPSVFFTETTAAGALCPNTTYEFAAWILNIGLPSNCGGHSILPNITFSIETTNGTVLQTYNTGDIPTSANVNWVQYGTFFTTPAGNSQPIVVKMINNAPGGCGNDIALDDITFRACGPVIQTGFSSINGTTVRQLCEKSHLLDTIRTSVQSGSTLSYQWQSNFNGLGWTDVTGAAGKVADSLLLNMPNVSAGTYQYRLGVSNGSADIECRTYSQTLTINVLPLPVVPAIEPQSVCEGNTIQLKAFGGATYIWTGPNLKATMQNPLVINNATAANSGTYTVSVISADGCAAPPVQTTVTVVPKILPVIYNADTTICAGEPVQLKASGGLYYKWLPPTGLDNDDIPNPIARPSQTTKYSVHISNAACIDSTKSVTIYVNQLPVANAGSNLKLFEGQSAILNGNAKGDSIINIYWTPTTGLYNPTVLNPIASPTDNTTYTLHVVSKTCGADTSSVFVRVYKKISIPNTFSPNNDGTNDFWDIKELITYPEALVSVYNRSGQQVYQSIGYGKPWDGTYNSSPLPIGTYYYTIDFKIGTPIISGWVVIVR